MGVLFHLPASGAADVSPTPSATDWDGHVNSLSLKMGLTRTATALTTVAYAPDAGDHLVDLASMHSQFVSEIFAPQAIAAQQIMFGARCLEAVATNNLWPAWKLYCVNVAGSSVLATILAIFKSATAEMATALTGYAEARLGSAVTLNEPWRLVLEIGADGLPTNTATDNHNHSYVLGDPVAAAGAHNWPQQADTTACAPILVFANGFETGFSRRRAFAQVGM
jgi:hypothetical protein